MSQLDLPVANSGRADGQSSLNIEMLIADLAISVRQQAPALYRLFEVFAQEARFGREWLAPSLAKLNANDAILEVGGGLMILSAQLVREGYAVTALEPIGSGFSNFSPLQRIILEYAERHEIMPIVVREPVENFYRNAAFEFAFSINVMEHVTHIEQSILAVCRALKPGAAYRFTCPNYLFPYEPHFNSATLFSKRLTAIWLREKIIENSESANLWKSLNWISVPKIKKCCESLANIELRFNSRALCDSLERVAMDQEFASRRPGWLRQLAKCLLIVKLHKLTLYVPEVLSPIIDCTIAKGTEGQTVQQLDRAS